MTGQTQAQRDAHTAWMYAINSVLHDDRPPPGRTAAEMFEDYASDLLDQIGADRDRLLAAARQACIEAAEHVAYPGQWRSSLRAVELCQRAAEMVKTGAGA